MQTDTSNYVNTTKLPITSGTASHSDSSTTSDRVVAMEQQIANLAGVVESIITSVSKNFQTRKILPLLQYYYPTYAARALSLNNPLTCKGDNIVTQDDRAY